MLRLLFLSALATASSGNDEPGREDLVPTPAPQKQQVVAFYMEQGGEGKSVSYWLDYDWDILTHIITYGCECRLRAISQHNCLGIPPVKSDICANHPHHHSPQTTTHLWSGTRRAMASSSSKPSPAATAR